MKSDNILSERKNEFRIQSQKDLEGVKEYLEEQFEDTVENLDWLGVVNPESSIADLKDKYNGVGELKIKIEITHEI